MFLLLGKRQTIGLNLLEAAIFVVKNKMVILKYGLYSAVTILFLP